MGPNNSKSKSNKKNSVPIDKSYEELSMSENEKTICVVGAGLAGCLTALLLSKLGFKVYVYEKRNV